MLYLQGVVLQAERAVDAHRAICAHGNLPGSLVKDDGLQWLFVVIVYCLEQVLGSGEDGKTVAGDVGLESNFISFILGAPAGRKTHGKPARCPVARGQSLKPGLGLSGQDGLHATGNALADLTFRCATGCVDAGFEGENGEYVVCSTGLQLDT